ncbi:hypothetical protein ACFY1C_20020 [Streptomyces sp. NPDC001279]|uniref:hypothetical protein n=1 Tax=Streptomyces sp. NPDC001279 TaxID=3364556 RepID=UPI0036967D82
MELTPEQQRDDALMELARLRAGLAVGLTPEQSARLTGTTPEELAADARTFAAELGARSARKPSAGGSDVGSSRGSVDAGAARYRAKYGDGQRPTHTSYQMENA